MSPIWVCASLSNFLFFPFNLTKAKMTYAKPCFCKSRSNVQNHEKYEQIGSKSWKRIQRRKKPNISKCLFARVAYMHWVVVILAAYSLGSNAFRTALHTLLQSSCNSKRTNDQKRTPNEASEEGKVKHVQRTPTIAIVCIYMYKMCGVEQHSMVRDRHFFFISSSL